MCWPWSSQCLLLAGENDVTIIFKPFPGAKRWQHLQRQQGPAGGEQLAVEANYTVILGSHRNSKLKIEKNGEELAVVSCSFSSAASSPGPHVSAQHGCLACLAVLPCTRRVLPTDKDTLHLRMNNANPSCGYLNV